LHWKYAHLLYQGLKKDREALEHLRRVTELVPHSVRGYSGMAFILHRLGDADGAIDNCRKALAIDPANAEIENILAAAFELKGWAEKAETRYKKAIKIQPYYSAPYGNLALMYARSRRLQDAVDLCRRGLMLITDAADLSVTLAECLNRMGRRDEAIKELKEAQRLDPQNASVNHKLDEILWEKIKSHSP
jgi:Flp pilus assembly protein TadD